MIHLRVGFIAFAFKGATEAQLKALEAISRLQNFANILTSVKGCNEKALGQISLYREDDVCDQDYNNIIKCK